MTARRLGHSYRDAVADRFILMFDVAEFREAQACLVVYPTMVKAWRRLWTETEHCKVVIERSYPVDAEPAHHSKARSINYRKVLIFARESNLPGGFQICHADRLYDGHPASHAFPESLPSFALDSITEQRPGLHQHVISGEQRLTGLENSFGAGVAGVDKHTHGREA